MKAKGTACEGLGGQGGLAMIPLELQAKEQAVRMFRVQLFPSTLISFVLSSSAQMQEKVAFSPLPGLCGVSSYKAASSQEQGAELAQSSHRQPSPKPALCGDDQREGRLRAGVLGGVVLLVCLLSSGAGGGHLS